MTNSNAFSPLVGFPYLCYTNVFYAENVIIAFKLTYKTYRRTLESRAQYLLLKSTSHLPSHPWSGLQSYHEMRTVLHLSEKRQLCLCPEFDDYSALGVQALESHNLSYKSSFHKFTTVFRCNEEILRRYFIMIFLLFFFHGGLFYTQAILPGK